MSQKNLFETLNALRGVAAIAVVLWHMKGRFFDRQIASSGYLAVDLFFVLSGFVIASAYDLRLASGLPLRRFALMRAIRFWPLVLLGMGLGALTFLESSIKHLPGAMTPLQLATSITGGLLLIPTIVTTSGALFAINPPLWTLSCEMIVNLAYAALFRFMTSAFLVGCACFGAILVLVQAMTIGSTDFGFDLRTFAGGIGRAIFGFSIGVMIFRRGWRAALLPTWGICALLAVFLIASIGEEWRLYYDLLFIFLLSPILVIIGASVEPEISFRRLSSYLGSISFVLYATHVPLIGWADRLFLKSGLDPNLRAITFLAGLLVIAPLVDRRYDIPFRRYLTDVFGASRTSYRAN